MQYEIEFKPKSIKDLKKIDRKYQKIILEKIEKLSYNMSGDIKKLTNFSPEYRMRIGIYRVLFEIENNNKIVIYSIVHRNSAYN